MRKKAILFRVINFMVIHLRQFCVSYFLEACTACTPADVSEVALLELDRCSESCVEPPCRDECQIAPWLAVRSMMRSSRGRQSRCLHQCSQAVDGRHDQMMDGFQNRQGLGKLLDPHLRPGEPFSQVSLLVLAPLEAVEVGLVAV